MFPFFLCFLDVLEGILSLEITGRKWGWTSRGKGGMQNGSQEQDGPRNVSGPCLNLVELVCPISSSERGDVTP